MRMRKIHKNAQIPLGRPTVSGTGGPTKKISQFVDHFSDPMVALSTSYLKSLHSSNEHFK